MKLLNLFFIILAGVAGWAVYGLINTAFSDILGSMGVENYYFKQLIVIGIIFGGLYLLGKKSKILEALK